MSHYRQLERIIKNIYDIEFDIARQNNQIKTDNDLEKLIEYFNHNYLKRLENSCDKIYEHVTILSDDIEFLESLLFKAYNRSLTDFEIQECILNGLEPARVDFSISINKLLQDSLPGLQHRLRSYQFIIADGYYAYWAAYNMIKRVNEKLTAKY